MIYQVLKATWENPIKNDFVKMCQKHLSDLDINLSFSEIENMSHWSFKNLVKVKTEAAGFNYLLEQKGKQIKTMDVEYSELKLQEYFIDGNCSKKMSKLLFKTRSLTLDIKTQQKWKYADSSCIGCKIKEESGDELLICNILSKENSVAEKRVYYNWFYSNNVANVVKAGKFMEPALKERQKIIEAGVT